MKYFPQWALKNRYVNKALKLLNLLYQKSLLLRMQSSTFDLQKLGSEYGGWYVPVQLIQPSWIIYSAGIGVDITFDQELIEKFDCTVYGFDPTPEAIYFVQKKRQRDGGLRRFVFTPVGLWHTNSLIKFYAPRTRGWVGSYSIHNLQGSEAYVEAQCQPLGSIMADLGHAKIHLLKMDIEGAEYEVLANILDDTLEIDWLCVEFDQPVPFWTMSRMLSRLRRHGFVLQMMDRWNFTFAHCRVFGSA